MTDVTTDLFRVLITFVVTAVGGVSWWGIRRIVSGQDQIAETLTDISDRLGHINGRVGKMETHIELHEKQDDERHEHIEKETDALWSAVRHR